jgi:hypothetical protein
MIPVWADPWNYVNPSIREDTYKQLTIQQANVLEGSISIETTPTAPSRQLNITFVDTEDEFDLGSVDGTTSLTCDKMIRVWYQIYVPEFTDHGGWMECPVFSGHIATVDKQAEKVTLSALSKDARYLEPCLWSPTLGENKQLWAGLLVTDAIRYILGVHGEQMFRIPAYTNRLRYNQLIKWNDVPWAVCQKLAQAQNMSLYFDGYGDCVLKRFDDKKVDFELDGGLLTEFPNRRLDFTDMRNVVVFLGHKPEGGSQVRAVARRQNHPLDRQYIKQWKVEVIENSNVKRHDVAMSIAQNALGEKLKSAFSIEATSLVLPRVEEWDMIRVRDPIKYGLSGYPYGGAVNVFKLNKATIPLDNKSPMTINREYPFSYKLKKKKRGK